MKVSRRDLLLGTAGMTAGLVFTPVPWKLLGDVSIWTQNWPWIPQPAHGPVETRQTTCTLCAAGCGMRVRTAEGWPVGISGISTHPVTKGALCPLGFAAQQLNWHPRRLRELRHRGRPALWEEAQAAFAKACAEGPVAIVDGRPGRAASAALAAFAEKHNGNYRVTLDAESQALGPYNAWSGVAVSGLGYDLENARTILSFGTPLLDGWGTPGRFTRLWSARAAGAREPQLRLIQADPNLTRTAARAWKWVAIREGSESALAAGLARVLVEERLVAAKGPVPAMTLGEAAAQTGVSVDAMRELARVLVASRPSVVIAADNNKAVAALNVLLGSVGTPGGIVVKNRSAKTDIALEENTAACRAVLLDATVPWDFVPRTNAEVFRFAAWDGGGQEADWLLPCPGFLEETTDVPTAPTLAVETYSVAVKLTSPPEVARSVVQFLAKIDSTLPDPEKLIHARCEEIFKGKRGTVYGDHRTATGKFDSAAKLEEQLRKGAVWVGEVPQGGVVRCTLKEWPGETSASPAADWAAAWALPVLPPLAGKLYQESNLRKTPARRQA